MGPWNHGGWRNEARAMAVVDPGTADAFLRDVEAPWFAYWLHDKGSMSEPTAYLYDAGAKRWRSFDTWPPKSGASDRKLYLHANGTLSFDAPKSEATQYDQFVSDPAHPVPYRPRPVEQTYDPRGSRWRTWETQDQRFVQGRPDVLTWESAPLAEDVTIAGDVIAHLVASTTGQDADWVVKLIDVFPDSVPSHWDWSGYQLMVAHEIMRGRYREGFTAPKPLHVEHAAAVHGRSAPADVHVREGPPDDGAGAEHLVPALRSESADVGAEHLPGEGERLQGARRTACGTRPSRRRTSR